jgi:spermidine synthase
MRILLYASWHHFAFLVMSVALLGFGASGTALCLAGRGLERRAETALFALVLAAAFSLPAASRAAAEIGADARFLPALLARQIGAWSLYWAVWFVPFFIGAAAIGLALASSRERAPTIYGFNLLGSALGACAAPIAMSAVHPKWLPVIMGAVTLCAALPLRPARSRRGIAWIALAGAGIAVFVAVLPPRIRVDPFKYASYAGDLVTGGRAALAARAYSPRSVVEIYSGGVFHEIAFLSPGEVPPPLFAVTRDGHWAGSVLRVLRAEDAAVADNTMMAVPYAFAPERPSVLLLGETGGSNVWLAARRGARSVEVVQPDRAMMRVIRRELSNEGGAVFDLPGVSVTEEEPRRFVDRSREKYDLVQLSGLESWAVAAGGLAGLEQNHLMTVEGIGACLERLSPRGILTVCRAVEVPPQTSAKILATIAEALARRGVENPAAHVVVVRDYLSSCVMARTAPWGPGEIERVRLVCGERELTPVFFAGIRDDELNAPDRIPGPPGQTGDWLHYAASALFSGGAKRFIREWPFDIEPPTDDRPFFDSLGKIGSIALLRRTYGDLWLTRTEIGFLFVLLAALIVAAAGLALTLLPLDLVGAMRRIDGRGAAALYFAAIGLGYMTAEICVLSRLTRAVGDPVLAGAATIAGFLFFSGAGSLAAQRIDPSRDKLVCALLVAAAAACAIAWIAAGRLAGAPGPQSLAARIAAACLVVSPAAFLMGFPMALGLRRAAAREPALVPWAWGVNGFASVLAPPLATAIALAAGFTAAIALAVAAYIVACAAYRRLPGGKAQG